MLYKIKHNLTVLAAKKLLDSNKNKSLSTAKRVVSILAGAYIVQRGLRAISKRPVIAVQEAILGSFLIYDAVRDIRDTYPKRPTLPAQIRKNQIQGNDPSSGIAEFV